MAVIVAKLLSIFEKMWQAGEVAGDWKKKKKTMSRLFFLRRDDPRNYQPFSLISVLEKIMDQNLIESMLRHVEERVVMWDNQHGFTKSRSCLTTPGFYDNVTVLVGK